MKKLLIATISVSIVISFIQSAFGASIVALGWDNFGQTSSPAGNDYIAVAAGHGHSVALKSDGSIIAWGWNDDGQATPPTGNDFVAIAAGYDHCLALKSDGSIVCWGSNGYGQAIPPEGNDFVAIAANGWHSLALKKDGSIICWGDNRYDQSISPSGRNFVAIAAGWWDSLAIKDDGSIFGWGANSFRQEPPAGNNFVAISAGAYHGLALRSDGSVAGWGDNDGGRATPPAGNDFIAIAAGFDHGMALKSDGSIVGWGKNQYGQATSPGGNDFVAITAGSLHSLLLVEDDVQESKLIGLYIVGPNEVAEESFTQYSAIALYEDDSTKDVTNRASWAVMLGNYADISEFGLLRTNKLVMPTEDITIYVEYEEANTVVQADKNVQVFASYPAVIPTEFKLTASDGESGDYFGYAVSIDCNRCIVGARLDDDKGENSGSAYIFEWNGTSWSQKAKLMASDGAQGNEFGWAVSISGDRCVVGAPFDDDKGSGSGSAYIFEWNGTSWSQQAKLTASDGASWDLFGYSVSISGDRCVVGAIYDDNNKRSDSGSAYIFEWNGTSWTQQAKLTASDGASSDYFGFSVNISGNRCVVAARDDDDKGDGSGSVYIFEWNGTSWSQQTKLTASDGASRDLFGCAVSTSGDRCVVGAYGDDDKGSRSGSAYIFEWNGTSWSQQAKLTASDGTALDFFGFSVSISGDRCIAGAYWDDDNGSSCGSAYIFEWNGTSWTQQTKLTPSDGTGWDFGYSVSISGDHCIVGARNGENNGTYSGSAYIYHFNEKPIAIAGPNQIAYAFLDGLADVTLDGSASYDDDNDVLNYYWSWTIDGNLCEANGVSPAIQLPVGEHQIELIVDDGWISSEPNYCTITVIEPLRTGLWLWPRTLNCNSRPQRVMTMMFLPKDIEPNDVDNQPLTMYPCDIQSKYHRVYKLGRGKGARTVVMAIFDKDEICNALDTGWHRVEVAGRLQTGQYFYGSNIIRIIRPHSHKWPFRRFFRPQ